MSEGDNFASFWRETSFEDKKKKNRPEGDRERSMEVQSGLHENAGIAGSLFVTVSYHPWTKRSVKRLTGGHTQEGFNYNITGRLHAERERDSLLRLCPAGPNISHLPRRAAGFRLPTGEQPSRKLDMIKVCPFILRPMNCHPGDQFPAVPNCGAENTFFRMAGATLGAGWLLFVSQIL